MKSKEARAAAFAEERHAGQLRKYTLDPYINHPAAVVRIVRSVPHNVNMLAAAWMHDLIEDTPTTADEIESKFGLPIACLVQALTDVSKPEDGNREKRKAIDRAHLAKASSQAQTIKLADIIHNSASILRNDELFARTYIVEKAMLLDVLTMGDRVLHQRATRIVDQAISRMFSPLAQFEIDLQRMRALGLS